MEQKPKLEVKQYKGDGKYDYAIFRADRPAPLCKGISKLHGEHLKVILGRMEEIPDKEFPPIKDWYNYDEIIEVNDA